MSTFAFDMMRRTASWAERYDYERGVEKVVDKDRRNLRVIDLILSILPLHLMLRSEDDTL